MLLAVDLFFGSKLLLNYAIVIPNLVSVLCKISSECPWIWETSFSCFS